MGGYKGPMLPENDPSSAPTRRPLPRLSAGGLGFVLYVVGMMIVSVAVPGGHQGVAMAGGALCALGVIFFGVACLKVLWAIALKLTTQRDRPFRSLVAPGNVVVAVLAVLVGGAGAAALYGFDQVKYSAMDNNARNRVYSAQSMIEEHHQETRKYPEASEFAALWKKRRPDDYLLSPWAGTLKAPAVLELPVLAGTHATAEAAQAAPNVVAAVKDPAHAGWVFYARIHPPGTWRAIKLGDTDQIVVARDYVVGIYGREGTPWWYARGGAGSPAPSPSGEE